MKSFSQFRKDASNSLNEYVDKDKNLAVFNAKRVVLPNGGRLVSDGHGKWYNSKTRELEAESETGVDGVTRLKWYNQNQKPGRDPDQDRTKLSPLVPKNHQTNEEYQKVLREKYIKGEIFKENEWVQSVVTEQVGRIIRRGTNYLICVTEDNEMFKPWIKDVIEWTEVSGVPADQREVGTPELVRYTMKMTGTKKISNFNLPKFLNKFKVKKK